MCDRLPADLLPAAPATVETAPERGLQRRTVVAGLSALLLTACARPRGRRQRRSIAAPAAPLRGNAQAAAGRRTARPVAPYRVYRRAEWGAESLKDNHDPMAKITRVTLHHTATSSESGGQDAPERSDLTIVKGVQDFHRNKRGWADIGYHWLIGRDGNVYEGRVLSVQGAHAGGGNNVENLGISAIGDFTQSLPGERQLRTISTFLATQLQAYGLSADALYGHRDFKATECPGGALYAWLEEFKGSRA